MGRPRLQEKRFHLALVSERGLYEAVAAVALRHGVSMAAVVRWAVRDYLAAQSEEGGD